MYLYSLCSREPDSENEVSRSVGVIVVVSVVVVVVVVMVVGTAVVAAVF